MKKIKQLSTLLVNVLLAFGMLASLSSAQAALLLSVDLSVEDQITITATDGVASATVSGDDFIGFYLENFFEPENNSLSDILVSGDLVSAQDVSDLTPDLFRSDDNDTGLNVWSYADGAISSFVANERAFEGSATWTISSGAYQNALNGAMRGDIWFPADDINDLPSAIVIGQWAVVDADVPEAPTFALFSLLLFAFSRTRKA
ncbi:hypothetical protein OPS25_14055 [Alteromonas ponticola]|uniref:PEP-CTERM sorting domain-containing protein n=1 Tax=Alteromonas aquimaris TaxID=2998417 RepID=A0ABT3PA21_9ALTE|nr:hypothetical protein [Alteromonas aquimaris]MCW8109629.1 hypothetical protein [Alteromonas aquimaris]